MKRVYLLLTILIQVSVAFSQTHFTKGFVGSGYNQMNLVFVNAQIDGVGPLGAGDEIAVYDGNLCVGAVLLTKTLDPSDSLTFVAFAASSEEAGDQAGFRQGNKMYFRFWDSSAGIEYHNVIPIVTNNKGIPITNSFEPNGTSYINASTTSTEKVWNPVEDEGTYPDRSWNTPENWNPNGVPEPFSDVIIPSGIPTPIIGTNVGAYCGKITLNNTTSLQISSGATGTGSLIVSSNISGSGPVSARRWVVNNGWHLVSSPVNGQNISGFVTSAANDIPEKGGSRGMMNYNEVTDDWNSYFTNTTSGQISKGNGYCLRRSASDGFINFTGSLTDGNVQVSVSKSKFGWNLIGNPFTSAMYVKQEVNGFLTVNEAKIDPSYLAMYLWDPVKNNYIIINKDSTQANVASGQGFFIKASGTGPVTFNKQMQVHQTDALFKSAKISSPYVRLVAKSGELNSSVKISFNEEMTLGLDPGYDAGILRSGQGFDIYSKLVNDNGVDFAIQALPGKSTDSYVIPIGVDAVKGGEIVFSVNSLNLPAGYDLMIEDKLTNSIVNLKNGEVYVANVASDNKGTGRFYLHVGSSVQTAVQEIQQNELSVYTIDQTLYIKGNVGKNAQFMVYSIDGRLINRFGATSQNLNQMTTAGFTPGIYFVNVLDKTKYKPVKFVVGK